MQTVLARAGVFNLATRDNVNKWLVNHVSVAEISRRVNEGVVQMLQAPPAVRAFFAEHFGPSGDAALTSYILDADQTEAALLRQVEIAHIGGAANLADIGIGFEGASRLSDLGITFEAARQGFSRINAIRPLFEETVTETTDLTRRGTGVASEFALDAGEAFAALRRRRDTRLAAFAGGGGAAALPSGFGLGAAE